MEVKCRDVGVRDGQEQSQKLEWNPFKYSTVRCSYVDEQQELELNTLNKPGV